jgi:hypothetical protein
MPTVIIYVRICAYIHTCIHTYTATDVSCLGVPSRCGVAKGATYIHTYIHTYTATDVSCLGVPSRCGVAKGACRSVVVHSKTLTCTYIHTYIHTYMLHAYKCGRPL